MATIYDYTAQSNKGTEINFADMKGKVILIVNTASMRIHTSVQRTGRTAPKVPVGRAGGCGLSMRPIPTPRARFGRRDFTILPVELWCNIHPDKEDRREWRKCTSCV